MTEKVFYPVFKKDDQEFVILHNGFFAESTEHAWRIGIATSFVEAILYGFVFTHKVVAEGTKVDLADLGNMKVGIITEAVVPE